MRNDLALNAVCPYYTMFPLEFPLRALERRGTASEWVLDPFCGRGTTNFAARCVGRPSLGVDSSRVAIALAEAKLPNVEPAAVVRLGEEILSRKSQSVDVPTGSFWNLAYHPATLFDLCRLRAALLVCSDDVARVLRAIVLGALHGPLTKGAPSYFSNQCTRTFAPKPAYAVRFWRAQRLRPRPVEVLPVIAARARRYLSIQPKTGMGSIVLGDSRNASVFGQGRRFTDVVTSPPYYGMRTYIPDQWLRSWFLGAAPTVSYKNPLEELTHHSPEDFTSQLATVWRNASAVCLPRAQLVARFGGIRDRKQDPVALIKKSLQDTGWRIATIRSAGTALNGRRQAAQFKRVSKPPREEYDVYAQLAP